MWGRKNGTCASVRLIEGVSLIWGPLNTGLTVIQNFRRRVSPPPPLPGVDCGLNPLEAMLCDSFPPFVSTGANKRRKLRLHSPAMLLNQMAALTGKQA